MTELSGLRQKVTSTIQTTDAAKLQQLLTQAETTRVLERTATAQQANPQVAPLIVPPGAVQRFQVMDADTYTLATRSDVASSKLAWDGLLAYAEHYPEVADLQHLSALAVTPWCWPAGNRCAR